MTQSFAHYVFLLGTDPGMQKCPEVVLFSFESRRDESLGAEPYPR
jgi:hypothetical protein